MRIVRNVLIGLIALLVVGGVAWAFNGGPLTRKSPLLGGDVPVKLANDFAIAPSAIPDEFQCKDASASLANAHGPFLYSDSLSSALNEQKDTKKATAELNTARCTEVGTGYATALMLAAPEAKIDADTTLLQKNAWLGDFIAKGQSDANLSKVFMAYNQASVRYETTPEYRTYAGAINYLMSKFNKVTIEETRASAANWFIRGRDRFAVDPKTVLIPLAVRNTDYQENKPAVWFTAVDKNDACHLVVGFNLGDKRPEIGSCDKPQPTPAPTAQTSLTPAPSATTTSSGGGGSTTHTTSTSTTTTTKSCPAGTTGTYPNCLQVKTGSNPGLNPGTKETNTVNNNDGATDSKGVQANPAAAASSAASQASASAATQASVAASASASASTDSGGGSTPHTSAPPPGPGW